MPKCKICGKKFDTLAALREHHRAVHTKARFVAPKAKLSRNLVIAVILVLVIIGALVGYLIYTSQQPTIKTSILGQQISDSLYENLTTVSDTTLATVGSSVSLNTHPTAVSAAPLNLTVNGKVLPEVLYIGAEFCPNCAAERWSMVIALSKFGTFSNIEYWQSSEDGIYTLTFANATYSSPYIAFVPIENENNNHVIVNQTTPQENLLWNQYNGESYPFIDIGGKYVITEAQYLYTYIGSKNWTQIGSQLNNSSNSLTQLIDGAANNLIAAICKVDGGSPSSVCTQSFAQNVSFSVGTNSATVQSSYLVLTEAREIDLSKR